MMKYSLVLVASLLLSSSLASRRVWAADVGQSQVQVSTLNSPVALSKDAPLDSTSKSVVKEETPVKFGVQMRLRPEYRNNTDYGGNRSYTLLRFRLSTTFKAGPKTTLFFQPQFSKAFGTPSFVGTSPTANTFQQSSGAFFDTALIVHQAYLDYRPFDDLQMVGGRQILTYGDELLIGAALGWANVGRSFDGIKLVYSPRKDAQTDFFWSRLVDTSTFTRAGTGNSDFFGLYESLKISEFFEHFDPYIFYLIDSRPIVDLTLWTAGLRMKSQFGKGSAFDYRAETTYQNGNGISGASTAFQEDLEFGLTIPSSNFRVALNGFYASSEFNQLFPAAHKFLGIADVLGRRNLYGGAIRTTLRPNERWNISLDLFQFYRASTTSPLYALNGLTPLGSASATASSKVGTELDLNVGYKVSSDVNLNVGINTMFASDYLVSNFGSINPIYSFIELEAKY